MALSRTAAEEHSAELLRQLKSEGKLAKPIDEETAKRLLKTPPTNALRHRGSIGEGSDGSGSHPDSPSAGRDLRSSMLASGESGAEKPGSGPKRAGATGGGLPTSMAGASAAQVLEVLVEEAAAFPQAQQQHAKLSRDHMQRSLVQLFEDTVRDKFAVAGGDASSLRQHSGSAMGFSTATLGTSQGHGAGAATRALRALASSRAGAANVPSLRPVDRSGQLGSGPRGRGPDAMTDFVVPDAIRQQLITDINQVLDHELQRLSQLVLSEVNKVTSHVRQLSDRMSTCEEELLHATVELDVAATRLSESTDRVRQLEERVREVEEHSAAKDRQMDLLREQISRRNESLDKARTDFRKEVMRYKAKIYEFEQLDRVTAAVEAEERDVEAAIDEAVKKARTQFDREKRDLVRAHNAAISERDHEIMELRRKLKQSGPAAGGGARGAKSLTAGAPSSAAPTPEPGELDSK